MLYPSTSAPLDVWKSQHHEVSHHDLEESQDSSAGYMKGSPTFLALLTSFQVAAAVYVSHAQTCSRSLRL